MDIHFNEDLMTFDPRKTTTLYTMDGCKYCTLAKELLNRSKVDYNEMLLNRDITREQVLSELKVQTVTFPQIVSNGKILGGLVEAARHFKSIGLV